MKKGVPGVPIQVSDKNGKFYIPTNSDNHYMTTQLAIWRRLHVENDATAALYGLMMPGVTRQTNRFADAFIEPDYDTLAEIDTGNPATMPPQDLHVLADGAVHPNDVATINAARQSAAFESRQFWTVYATDVYAKATFPFGGEPEGDTLGVTFNGAVMPASSRWQASVVFTALIMEKWPGAQGATALQKVTIHEVAHQLLKPGGQGSDNHGHRGTHVDIETYLDEDEEYQLAPQRMEKINVMNADGPGVPMSNPTFGPKDWFFFHVKDIDKMRMLGQP